ncbi:MAG: hypothetical protein ACXVB0_10025 [Mucilaginibacter sp.]
MKKSIALAALLLALGTSVFAAAPAKVKGHKGHSNGQITFVPLKSDKGFGVKIDKEESGKSIVIVYDNEKNVVFKDLLSKGTSAEKGYVVTGLEDGDYTVEVFTGSQDVKKQLHVYDDGQAKSYVFIQ